VRKVSIANDQNEEIQIEDVNTLDTQEMNQHARHEAEDSLPLTPMELEVLLKEQCLQARHMLLQRYA